jgi:flagellar basal-body rod protein FlgG
MNQGTYPLAASMINQINRLDQISNNLANINTTGFKQEGTTETTFNYYLQKAQEEGIIPSKINTITNNIPKIDAKYINSEMGPIAMTGNTLDFALNNPDTFFKIQNADGDIVYSRDGAFKNLDNFLVDSNGNNVLNADNEPIVIEGNIASQLGVVKIPYTNLEKIGDNTYSIKDANQMEIFENNDSMITEGAIEKSNVNSVSAMVELIDAHRRFDQSQKAVKSIDELNAGLIDKIGSNTK